MQFTHDTWDHLVLFILFLRKRAKCMIYSKLKKIRVQCRSQDQDPGPRF